MCNARCRRGKKEGCRVITRGNVFAREPTNHVPVNFNRQDKRHVRFHNFFSNIHAQGTDTNTRTYVLHTPNMYLYTWRLNAGFELFSQGHSHLATHLTLSPPVLARPPFLVSQTQRQHH